MEILCTINCRKVESALGYYFSPGTRCKILDIEDEDLSEDILSQVCNAFE